jgi:hypothetical protein
MSGIFFKKVKSVLALRGENGPTAKAYFIHKAEALP